MDIKEFIASGILEHYVLGLTSEEEAQQVQAYAEQYPEVRKELDAIELALADFADANAVSMPEGLAKKILNNLDDSGKGEEQSTSTKAQPNSEKGGSSNREVIWSWLLGILFLAAVVLAFFFYNKGQQEAQKASTVQIQYAQLEENCASKDREIQLLKDQLAVIRRKGNQVIFLASDSLENIIANVHYNPSNQEIHLDVEQLPAVAEGKQYQLWAIVEGQANPIPMDVFDAPVDGILFKKLDDFIEKVQVFAVTVEDTGGSDIPTFPIFVSGKVEVSDS